MANAKVRLGKAFKGEDGTLHGIISGLGIGSTEFVSEPVIALNGNPYMKLIADPEGAAYEVGSAYPKDKDGMKYFSVSLESPVFPNPINAALFPDRNNANAFNLVWNRPEPKQEHEITSEIVVQATQQAEGKPDQKKGGFFRRGPTVVPQ